MQKVARTRAHRKRKIEKFVQKIRANCLFVKTNTTFVCFSNTQQINKSINNNNRQHNSFTIYNHKYTQENVSNEIKQRIERIDKKKCDSP